MNSIFKRALSILLVLVMCISLVPVNSFAYETNHTQAEAVAWIKAKADESWWDDVDGLYGCQCVDLIKAYYNWFGYSSLSGNGVDYQSGHTPPDSGWYYSEVPIPGSVFAQDNGTKNGHVGLVYSVEGNTFYTVETNTGDYGSGEYPAACAVYNSHQYYDGDQFNFICPDFLTSATLDVNGILDGNAAGNVSGYATFDVYLNGVLEANDVDDFCRSDINTGTSYNICDIKVKSGKAYLGVTSADRAGTLSGNTDVRLNFLTVDAQSYLNNHTPQTGVYGGHSYYYFNSSVTWWEAKIISENYGGHLVTITSSGENSFVKQMIGNEGCWIGLTDNANEGVWKWVNSETLSFSNWATGEPNNENNAVEGDENYAHILKNASTWNDSYGSASYGFICEIDKAYTVSFNMNGHGTAVAEQTVLYNCTATEPSNPTAAGYTFGGWYKEKDCTNAWNFASDRVTADTVLYAKWTLDAVPMPPCGTESDWVPYEALPNGATVTSEKWTYCTNEATTSESPTLDGWDYDCMELQQTGSGNWYYASYPSGFDTSHSLYSAYNKGPLSSTETDTFKRIASAGTWEKYIYYHWTHNMYELESGNYNVLVEDHYCWDYDSNGNPYREYYNFRAFESGVEYGQTDSNGRGPFDGIYYAWFNNPEDGSWWWYRFAVYKQTYTDYQKIYHFNRTVEKESATEVVDNGTTVFDVNHLIKFTFTDGHIDNDEDGLCDNCGETVDHVHNWGEWQVTKEATCCEEGIETRICSGCNQTETRSISTISHNLIHHEAKVPTCTEAGWGEYDTCSRCDYSTKVETSALGHDLIHHDAKEHSWTEPGWEEYDTCSRCEYTTYQEIPVKDGWPITYVLGYENADNKDNPDGYGRTHGDITLTDPTLAGYKFLGWYVDEGFTQKTNAPQIKESDTGAKTFYANWKAYTAFGTCGENLTWTLDGDGLLTISGTGKMTDYSYNGAPWCSNSSAIKTVKIESGVTSIGNDAFSNCRNLTGVEIGDSVTSIGDGAFYICQSLLNVEIPDSVTSIGSEVFSYCTNLTSVEIGDSVTGIGDWAFSFCTSLTSVEIPDSVTSIGCESFSSCTNLASIEIGDSVAGIGDYAFLCCTNLTSIEIPNSVTDIGDYAFWNCTSLNRITFDHRADQTLTVESYAFGVYTSDGSAIDTKVKVVDPNNINTAILGYDWLGTGRVVTYEKLVIYGDANLEGNVNVEDVYLLRKAAAGLATLTDEQKAVADVYTDGRYNALDVNLLRRFIAGIVTEIPYSA